MIEDYIIEALVTIGNHKRVMTICEPQVMKPFEITYWQVKRTLVALELLENELRIAFRSNGYL